MSIRSPSCARTSASTSSITSRLRSAEEVHLQEADLLDLAAARTAVTTRCWRSPFRRGHLGELQRHDLVERPIGDHDGRGMDRTVAHDALHAAREFDDPLAWRVTVDGLAQFLAALQALLERWGAASIGSGSSSRAGLRSRSPAEHARRVARRLPRRHAVEGPDMRDALAAVLFGDVTDHALHGRAPRSRCRCPASRALGFRKRSNSSS